MTTLMQQHDDPAFKGDKQKLRHEMTLLHANTFGFYDALDKQLYYYNPPEYADLMRFTTSLDPPYHAIENMRQRRRDNPNGHPLHNPASMRQEGRNSPGLPAGYTYRKQKIKNFAHDPRMHNYGSPDGSVRSHSAPFRP